MIVLGIACWLVGLIIIITAMTWLHDDRQWPAMLVVLLGLAASLALGFAVSPLL